MKQDRIVILDLGSTENTTIARAVRALGVYSEIYPHDISAAELAALPGVKGVIVNGGPNHVVDGREIFVADEVYACGLPVLAVDHPAAKTERQLAAWPEEDKLADALRPFVFDVCGAEANWNMPNFIADQIEEVRRQVGDKKVLLALSGGVDSSVVAALLLRAIGDQLTCVHVNHGLLRKGEPEQVVEVFQKQLGANLVYVDASERFLGKLAGVADPEQKRKIIGAEFIRVFEEEARKLEGIDFLAQGTIYPDIVESGTKTAKMVKSHHNVGGLPEDLAFRAGGAPAAAVQGRGARLRRGVGAAGRDGLPPALPRPGPRRALPGRHHPRPTGGRAGVGRHPAGGICHAAGLDKKVWQYFTVVPDFKSVGVRDNARCFEYPVILRAVNTVDAMTATVEAVDWPILFRITDRILKEVKGVNRVCYDLSPKPTATIEWE